MSDHPGSSPTFSLMRVLVLAVPLVIAGYAGANWYKGDVQRNAEDDLQRTMAKRMLGSQEAQLKLSDRYADADGDLLADRPDDESEWLDPEAIVFSYVATSAGDAAEEEATWQEVTAALSEKLGKPVNYQRFSDPGEQLRAFRSGELHIAAFGTGEVPTAVNSAGFIPLCVPGKDDGSYGYTMQIIVPAGSDIHDPADIGKPTDEGKKRRMTFTRPNSNSGYKAAMVMLLDEHGLAPERDYNWGFSFGHEKSIQGIANKEFEAASVASDILQRMIAAGDVPDDAIESIYKSERFPKGALGYAYNLAPAVADAIREVLLDYEFVGTPLEEEFGGSDDTKFVAVDYRQDWENVRGIDAAVAKARAELAEAN